MITVQNYFKEVKSIDSATLPKALKVQFDFTKEATENHKTWEYYNAEKEIRDTIDDYFNKLNKFLAGSDDSEIKAKNAAKDLIRGYVKRGDSIESLRTGSMGAHITAYSAFIRGNKIFVDRLDELKVDFSFPLPAIFNELKAETGKGHKPQQNAKPKLQRQPEKPKPESNVEEVERIEDEVKFIKRYALMEGKTKTDLNILNFINSLQKAIMEKRIRKASPFAKEINYIQDNLCKLHNQLLKITNPNKRKVEIKINKNVLERFIEIGGSKKVRLSVNYLKRYIGIQGKSITKEKAVRLLSVMDKAVQSGKLKANDPFAQKLKESYSSLKHFTTVAKKNETLEVHEAVLNGINSALDGCNCENGGNINGLSGLSVVSRNPEPEIMSIDQAKEQEYEIVEVDPKWQKLIGEFSLPTQFFVHGLGGSGKSSFVMLFSQHLAQLGYNILYVAGEQFNTPTFTQLLNRLNINAGDNFKIVKSLDTLNPADFDFIVLDSKDYLEIDADDFLALLQQYPGKSFIVLSQSVKTGNFTGKERWRNIVDVMLLAENGVIRCGHDKNRWGGSGEVDIFEDQELRLVA